MSARRSTVNSLGVAILLVAPVLALAHGDEHEEGEEHGHEGHPTGDHEHASPHGGIAVSAGDYHVELGVTEQTVWVYLLDEAMTTLPVEGVTGRVIATTGSGIENLTLAAAGERLEAAATARLPEEFIAAVQLTLASGDPVTARVEYDAALASQGSGEGSDETAYTCPMHPEIVQAAPGNCPICGMALVRPEAHEEHEQGEGGAEHGTHGHHD